MLENVLSVLAWMFTQIFALFDKVFSSFGASGLVLGAFIIWTIYRMLLAPVLGGLISAGTSDIVKKVREDGRGGQAVTGLENAKKGKRK